MFAAAEFNLNGKLSISELGNWVEVNQELMNLLNRSEPDTPVFDRDEIFLPFARSTRSIEPLIERYLKKKKFALPGESSASLLPSLPRVTSMLGKMPSTHDLLKIKI